MIVKFYTIFWLIWPYRLIGSPPWNLDPREIDLFNVSADLEQKKNIFFAQNEKDSVISFLHQGFLKWTYTLYSP